MVSEETEMREGKDCKIKQKTAGDRGEIRRATHGHDRLCKMLAAGVGVRLDASNTRVDAFFDARHPLAEPSSSVAEEASRGVTGVHSAFSHRMQIWSRLQRLWAQAY